MSLSGLLTITGLFDLVKNIFGLIKNFLNLFLKNTYKKSHNIWLAQNHIGNHWYKHDTLFEYSVYFPNITEPSSSKAMIAIRALNDRNIEHLSLNIEVDSAFRRYVEPITNLKDITKKPIFYHLKNIPSQDLVRCDESVGIIFAWDEFRIDIIELEFSNTDETITNKRGITHHLSHTWLLNSFWINCNGKCYNTDAIEECKKELNIWWRYGFAKPKSIVFTTNPQPTSIAKRFKNILIQPIIALIIWIATRNIALSLQFWIAILFQLFVFADNEKIKWRWSKNNSFSSNFN
ncbi:hypothetical protein MMP74_02540 [Acinetobacter sp. NIPH 1869]|uniref:hypothetical protein n=1 Tax=Acinetobacter higginsii TaxID=70347 RepID=UPI001F4B6416|nr:hypothetical protein [Acinetobacter higginsii]MCH7303279.1 hypothetical protein [Acinetobacter higginsii]